MTKIVNIDNGVMSPTEEILQIDPFKTIWKRDKNNHKTSALADFRFIEFMVSPLKSNPYRDLDTEEKAEVIISEIFSGDYKPDKKVLEGIDIYRKWIYEYSFSYKFLESAKVGAKELIKFFTTLNINERTNAGTAVYKPSDLTRALKDVEDIIKNLNGLEKRVFEEIKEVRIKGNKDINPLEV